jgi:hypothetical protein
MLPVRNDSQWSVVVLTYNHDDSVCLVPFRTWNLPSKGTVQVTARGARLCKVEIRRLVYQGTSVTEEVLEKPGTIWNCWNPTATLVVRADLSVIEELPLVPVTPS